MLSPCEPAQYKPSSKSEGARDPAFSPLSQCVASGFRSLKCSSWPGYIAQISLICLAYCQAKHPSSPQGLFARSLRILFSAGSKQGFSVLEISAISCTSSNAECECCDLHWGSLQLFQALSQLVQIAALPISTQEVCTGATTPVAGHRLLKWMLIPSIDSPSVLVCYTFVCCHLKSSFEGSSRQMGSFNLHLQPSLYHIPMTVCLWGGYSPFSLWKKVLK